MSGTKEVETKESLSHRVIRGGIWVFALRIIERVFSLVRLIILARILASNDFGLMGIALLTMATLETFSQTGFQEALIQKKHNTETYLDAAWTVLILRGLILFAILYLIAPYAAIFFKAPAAKLIIQIIGLSVLLKAFTNIGVIYFQKALEFNKQFVYHLSGTLANFIVAVSAAFILRSVWALVFGLLAGNAIRFIMSYLIHPYRPRLAFNLEQFKKLFRFGKWILGSSILVFLITQGDDILVGKLLGIAALGFYQMAYKFSNMPATEITHVISQVTFPAYSKLQHNLEKLRNAYLKVLQLTAFISILLAGGIFILAPEFTQIFLGEKWMPMVPAMQMLVFAGLVRSIGATTGPVFQAIGKPKIETKWQLIRLFILAALIYPFSLRWGILGASIAVFLSILVSTIGFNYAVIKATKCKIKNFSKVTILPLVNVILMILFISFLKTNLNMIAIWEFFLLAGFSVLIYISITYLLDRFLKYGMRPLIQEHMMLFRRN